VKTFLNALNKKDIISGGRTFSPTSNLTYEELKGLFLSEDVERSVVLWKPRNLFLLKELRNLLFFTRDFFLDFLPLKIGEVGCSETSVRN